MSSHRPALSAMAPWLGLTALVIILDQFSKHWVMVTLNYGDAIPVSGFFTLVLLYNTGAAFSFLADHSGWQRWFFSVLAIGISTWMLIMMYQHRHQRLLPCAFALVIGGAIGNVIDRFMHGAVVDFLYFHIGRYGWPAFNLADSAITLGVILMVWGQFRHPNHPPNIPENPA